MTVSICKLYLMLYSTAVLSLALFMADHEISETEEKTAWEGLLRRMLPPGAPLPDEEHLDYSISIDYIGPPLPSMSQTKRGGSNSSIATDPWRNPSSTAAAEKGRLSSKFSNVRCENVVRERQHDPPSEIEKFTQPISSPIRELGFTSGDADNSLHSDSNSMFSLKSLTIADDQFEARAAVGDVISNLDTDSRFSLRSLFATTDQSGNTISKTSHLGNGDGEISRDLGKRGTTERKAASPDTAVNAAIAREANRKESVCTKCRKGTRLNFRETCIVFGARYCRNCMCS